MAWHLLHQAAIFGGAVEFGGIRVLEHMRTHVFGDLGFVPAPLYREMCGVSQHLGVYVNRAGNSA
jgi:hypothetical protein